MNNILEYKGYFTKIHYDCSDNIVYGKIEGIRDTIDFHSEELKSIEREFHDAVNDYLEFCKEIGKKPDKPFKGAFNVRLPEQLHRKLYMDAEEKNVTMNKLIEKIINDYLSSEQSNVNYHSIPDLKETITQHFPLNSETKLSVMVGGK